MDTTLKQPAWVNSLRVILIVAFVSISANVIKDIIGFVKSAGELTLESYELNHSLSVIIYGLFSLFLLWQFYRLLPIFKGGKLISRKVYQQIRGIAFTVYYLLLTKIIFQAILLWIGKSDSPDYFENTKGYINPGSTSYRVGFHLGEMFHIIVNNIDLIIITAVLWLFTQVYKRAVLLQQEQEFTI